MKNKNNQKTLSFILLLLCASLFSTCYDGIKEPPLAEARSTIGQNHIILPLLSEMSEKECVEFIIENNVTIPDAFIDYPKLGAFVRRIIQEAEHNPNVPPIYNWDVAYYFAKSIQAVVNEYYSTVQRNTTATRLTCYLLDNWVFSSSAGDWSDRDGDWDPIWWNYNCYAYAIDRTEQPKKFPSAFQYQPGDFAHTGSFNIGITIYNLALVVIDDLELLGYDIVYFEDSTPNVPLESNQRLICIRRGDEDYHFMKYNKDSGYWYHKPGRTAPLRYRHHPSDL